MAIVREPAVAGRFYPANAKRLNKDLDSYLPPQKDQGSLHQECQR